MFTKTTRLESHKLFKVIVDGLYVDMLEDCPKDKGIPYEEYYATHKKEIMSYLEKIFTKEFLAIRDEEYFDLICNRRIRERYEGNAPVCGRRLYNLVTKQFGVL